MNEQNKSVTCEKHCDNAITEVLFAVNTLGAAVVIGAIYEPKIPPYSGD